VQQCRLPVATDERRVPAAGVEPDSDTGHRRHPPGPYRLLLSLEDEGLDRFTLREVLHEAPRRLADQDLARAGGLLEARRGVDGVTDSAVGRAGHEHLTRVDPIRAASEMPDDAARSAFNASRASCISKAARTARSASSSWLVGTPKNATTASPMNFSTFPLWRCNASRMAPKYPP
jgi:hypothetical protein